MSPKLLNVKVLEIRLASLLIGGLCCAALWLSNSKLWKAELWSTQEIPGNLISAEKCGCLASLAYIWCRIRGGYECDAYFPIYPNTPSHCNGAIWLCLIEQFSIRPACLGEGLGSSLRAIEQFQPPPMSLLPISLISVPRKHLPHPSQTHVSMVCC